MWHDAGFTTPGATAVAIHLLGPSSASSRGERFQTVLKIRFLLLPQLSAPMRSVIEQIPFITQDNPIGTGYSFVEDKELLVKTDEETANDITTLLIEFNRNVTLQKSTLYIVAESYGGKDAVTLGL
ncbi:serine carboxypeptidase-like protein 51 [Tanacetum coccineum]